MRIDEIWEEIIGHEERYMISNHGRIMNKNGKILKKRLDRDGYELINLYSGNGKKTYKVHRLVAIQFIPNNDERKTEVNHKDEVKNNNIVSNLEWCDHLYNNRYGTKSKRIAEKNSKKVKQFDVEGNLIKIHDSTRQIEREYGYKHTNISACCNGKYKRMYGSIWKYA